MVVVNGWSSDGFIVSQYKNDEVISRTLKERYSINKKQ